MTEATKKRHVTREIVDAYPLPEDDQQIVQVLRGCGNNLHEVVTAAGQRFLASMPTKFRRSVWIKRGLHRALAARSRTNPSLSSPPGDYLIVTPIEEGNKVRAEIHSILLKDQIRHIKASGQWPAEFEKDDAPPEEEEDTDDLLVPNLNRVHPDHDDSEEEDSEEEEEDDDESDDADEPRRK